MQYLIHRLYASVRLSLVVLCAGICLSQAELTAGLELPLIEIDGSGNIVAVWCAQAADGTNTIQAATKPLNGGWSSPTMISMTGVDSLAPKLAINSSGIACAAWIVKDATLGIRSLHAAILPSGSSWGSACRVSGSDCHVYDFSLKVDSAGDVVATWNAALISSDTSAIATATAPSNGSWGSPQLLMTE